MRPFSFSKSERLLNHADFVNLNRSGRRHRTKYFTLIVKQNGLGIRRLGVTVRKKTGNAVKRNRVKRIIRELFRLNKSHFPQGYDIVIVAKMDVSSLDFQRVKEDFEKSFFHKKLSF